MAKKVPTVDSAKKARVDVYFHTDPTGEGGAIPSPLAEIIVAHLETLMAIAQTTQQKIDAIGAALDAAATGLAADIQTLKDQLNGANNGMTEADVNAALAPLEARAQALADLDAQNPPTEPPPVA